MKIAVVSNNGSCGKTIVATQMLGPRIGCPIISVETNNESSELYGVESEKIGAKGKKFARIHAALSEPGDLVLDVGASNIVEFLVGLVNFDQAHLEIDYYVIPVTSQTREKIESIKMIRSLAEMGVPPDRIRIVFNRVQDNVAEEFEQVLAYVAKKGNATANPAAAIFETELFTLLAEEKLSVEALLADDTDYKALLHERRDASEDERYRWREMHGLKAMSRSVNRNLTQAFNALFE
jgi:hypothetical protein